MQKQILRWSERLFLQIATVLGIAAGGTLLGTVEMAYYVARVLTDPRRPGPMDSFVMTPFETGAEYEDVVFSPQSGEYTLRGWWFPRPESNRVIVGCHGYRGSKSELIGICSALWRSGFNVLAFDYQGHGDALGTPVTLGYREVRDFFAALDYVRQRVPDAQVGVIGFSMGASIAIIGSARRPDVRAVIADSPFSTHQEVLAHNIGKTVHVPGWPIAVVADFFTSRIAGYRGRDVEPVREVAAVSPRPLLIVHGTADEVIPVQQARQVFAAAREPKELWIAQGAPHCGAYFLDRPAYCNRVIEFFDKHLESSDATVPVRDAQLSETNQ